MGKLSNFQFSTQKISGFVVDMKGNDELCAVLVCSLKGVYTVLLINEQRLPIDSVNIYTMQPFTLVLTDTAVCSVAPNAVHIWKYKAMSQLTRTARTVDDRLPVPEYLKNEKVVHFDGVPTSGRRQELHSRKGNQSDKEMEMLDFLNLHKVPKTLRHFC